MKLQIAIDKGNVNDIIKLVEKVHDIVDIVEIGTSVVIREGIHLVGKVKDLFPNLEVLADTKIVDGGKIISTDSFSAGADIVTVLAMAEDATICDVVKVSAQYGRACMADLIGIEDIESRARQLLDLGVDYVSVHTGVDVQESRRTPLGDLKRLVNAIPHERAAVAGGIGPDELSDYIKLRPAIIIVGGALVNAADARQVAIDMKTAMTLKG